MLQQRYLREYGPLKQGLRQSDTANSTKTHYSPRVWSTKTRIKTPTAVLHAPATILREYGPLKQGLRLTQYIIYVFFISSPRVWSTKTRIKTYR